VDRFFKVWDWIEEGIGNGQKSRLSDGWRWR
jgi:hypothetical protein